MLIGMACIEIHCAGVPVETVTRCEIWQRLDNLHHLVLYPSQRLKLRFRCTAKIHHLNKSCVGSRMDYKCLIVFSFKSAFSHSIRHLFIGFIFFIILIIWAFQHNLSSVRSPRYLSLCLCVVSLYLYSYLRNLSLYGI